MNFDLTVRHTEVPDALKRYAEEKGSKLLKFYDRIETLHVVVDIQKPNYIVEMEANVGNKVPLVAKDSNEDMFAAVDAAESKLERQLKKFKEKLVDHRAEKASRIEPPTSEDE
ncbi:MAG: ribosome-associated translation inhibitor RaiA [Planctomycetota bacterium]